MKLLHINSYFSTTPLYAQLYNRQVDQGLDIDVYVPIARQFPQERMAVSGVYSRCVRVYNQVDRLFFHLKHYKILKDLLGQYQFSEFDLVHAHSLFSNGWLAYQLKQRFGLAYLVAVRNTDINTFFGRMPWLRSMGIKILQEANQIIFISKNTEQILYDKYIPEKLRAELQGKSQVIPNGIDAFWHQQQGQARNLPLQQPLKIVSTGKIMGLKRFPQLAAMVQAYNDALGPAELHIVGPDWNPKIVAELQAHPLVHYHGPKAKEELSQLYREMDLFALLSAPETFGLVYVEAMSQGLPLIYTKGQGFDSYFPNYQVGVSVDRNDTDGFIDAIKYIEDHYHQLSQADIVASRQFDWDQIQQQYLNIYQAILKEDSLD